MKRILMIIPNFGFGGAQKSFCRLANHLAKKHHVEVAVFNTEQKLFYDLTPKITDLSIPAGKNILLKIYYFFLRYLKLVKLKKEYKIEVCISYLEGANFLNVLSKHKDSAIISSRGSILHDETMKGNFSFLRIKLLIPFLYKRSTKIVALNEGTKSEMIDSFGIPENKIKIIENFFEIDSISKKANEEIDEYIAQVFDSTTIITAGRLAKEKGFHHLISIFVKLPPTFKLIILGAGEQLNELVLLARSLGLKVFIADSKEQLTDQQVLFLGYQKNPYKFIKRAKYFTMTSSSEGDPNALSESMICKTPVISVNCPNGPREKITPNLSPPFDMLDPIISDLGVLMPAFNKYNLEDQYVLWRDTILQLEASEEQVNNITENAYQHIQNYSPDKILSKWESIITNN